MDPVTVRIQADVAKAVDDISKASSGFRKFRADSEDLAATVFELGQKFSGFNAAVSGITLGQVLKELGNLKELTETEARSALKTLDQFTEKYNRLGRQVPDDVKKVVEGLKQQIQAFDQLAAAEKREREQAEASTKVRSQLSGEQLAGQVRTYIQALSQVGDLSKLTRGEVAQIAGVFQQWLEKAQLVGKEVGGLDDLASPAIQKIINDVLKMNAEFRRADDSAALFEQAMSKLRGVVSLDQTAAQADALTRVLKELGGEAQLLSTSQLESLSKQTLEVAERFRRLGAEVPTEIKQFNDMVAASKHLREEEQRLEAQARELATEQRNLANQLGGADTIRKAELYVKAIKDIGGTAKLTRSEQDQVNRILAEAVEKYRLIGRVAPAEMQQIEAATRSAAKATDTFWKDVLNGATVGTISIGYFVGNAMSRIFWGALNGIKDFVREAGEQFIALGQRGSEVMRITDAFNRLSIGAKQLPIDVLNAGRTALKGLATDFDVMSAANKAFLFGLDMTPKQFGVLAASAMQLGRAMNIGPGKALDDLIIALGRVSPRILDNLGIIVKVKDANTEYAAELHKTTQQLTAEERVLAFTQKALEVMERKLKDLGEVHLTFADNVLRARVMMTNLRDQFSLAVALSPALNVMLTEIGNGLANLFGQDLFSRIQATTKLVDNFAIGLTHLADIVVQWFRTQIVGAELFITTISQLVTMFYEKVTETSLLLTKVVSIGALLPSTIGDAFREALPFVKQLSEASAQATLKWRAETLSWVDGIKSTVKTFQELEAAIEKVRQKMATASKGGITQQNMVDLLAERMRLMNQQLDTLANNPAADDKKGPIARFRKQLSDLAIELKTMDLTKPENLNFVFAEMGERITDIVGKAHTLRIEVPAFMDDLAKRIKDEKLTKTIGEMMERLNKEARTRTAQLIKDGEQHIIKWGDVLSKETQRTSEFIATRIRDIMGMQIESRESQLHDIEVQAQAWRDQYKERGELTQQVLTNIDQWEEAAKRKVIEHWDAVTADIRAGALTIGNVLRGALADLPVLITQGLTGGGGIGGALKASLSQIGGGLGEMLLTGPIGQKLVTSVMNVFGQAIAEALGSILPGIGKALGALAGPLLTKVKEMFSKPGYKDVMRRVGNEWGATITEELAKRIDADAKKLFGGSRQAAEIFHFDEILKAAGGVRADNFDKLIGKLRDVFSMIQTGRFTAQQAQEVLAKNFQAFADYTERSGRVASARFVELLDLVKKFNLEVKEVTDFINSQTAKLGTQAADLLAPLNEQISPQATRDRVQAVKDVENAVNGLKKLQTELDILNKKVSDGTASEEDLARVRELVDLIREQKKEIEKAQEALDALNRKQGDSLAAVRAQKQLEEERLQKLIAERDLLVAQGGGQLRILELNKLIAESQQKINDLRDRETTLVAKSRDELERLTRLTLAAFNSGIQRGGDFITTLNNMGPGLDAIIQAYKDLGIEIPESFKEILDLRQRMLDNAPLVRSAATLNEFALTLSNLGGLTTETFKDLQDQGLETYDKLIAAGFTENQALMQMRGFLTTVRDAHRDLGLPIDENTQKLIDQATAAGILKDDGNELVDVMKEGFGALIELLGGKLPDSWKKVADSARDSANKIATATDGIARGVNGVKNALDTTDWESYASRAEEAADRVYDALDETINGRSPGGLIDVQDHIRKMGDLFDEASDRSIYALDRLYNKQLDVAGTPTITPAMMQAMPQESSTVRSRDTAAAIEELLAVMQDKPGMTFNIEAFSAGGMKSAIERELLPRLMEALQANRGGSLTQLQHIIGNRDA